MKTNVTVIAPCYKELQTIIGLIEAIRNQNSTVGDIGIVVADGMSNAALTMRSGIMHLNIPS